MTVDDESQKAALLALAVSARLDDDDLDPDAWRKLSRETPKPSPPSPNVSPEEAPIVATSTLRPTNSATIQNLWTEIVSRPYGHASHPIRESLAVRGLIDAPDLNQSATADRAIDWMDWGRSTYLPVAATQILKRLARLDLILHGTLPWSSVPAKAAPACGPDSACRQPYTLSAMKCARDLVLHELAAKAPQSPDLMALAALLPLPSPSPDMARWMPALEKALGSSSGDATGEVHDTAVPIWPVQAGPARDRIDALLRSTDPAVREFIDEIQALRGDVIACRAASDRLGWARAWRRLETLLAIAFRHGDCDGLVGKVDALLSAYAP